MSDQPHRPARTLATRTRATRTPVEPTRVPTRVWIAVGLWDGIVNVLIGLLAGL